MQSSAVPPEFGEADTGYTRRVRRYERAAFGLRLSVLVNLDVDVNFWAFLICAFFTIKEANKHEKQTLRKKRVLEIDVPR